MRAGTVARVAAPIVIKKYGNRRLYDTEESRYITLDELAKKIRTGAELRVVDAQTGEDLTQATLTQIVLETGHAAKFLPVQLLTQMIRLSDDSLAEFFSRYVTGALDVYLQAKRGIQSMASYNPMAQLPVAASDALARMWMTSPFAYGQAPGAAAPSPYGQPQPQSQPQPQPPVQPYTGYPMPGAFVVPPPPPPASPAAAQHPQAVPPEGEPEPAPTNGERDRDRDRDRDDSEVAAMRRELDELKQLIRESARPAAAPRERPARKKRKL
jgi:polyhydroxyalkanoate synthesis repressor PhaR